MPTTRCWRCSSTWRSMRCPRAARSWCAFRSEAAGPGSGRLDVLGHHLDRAARALGHADAAALAVVVVELEAQAGAELDDRVVGAHAVAVVALEAVAATQAAAGLEQRVVLGQAALHFVEAAGAPREVELRAHGLGRVAVVPGV